MIIASEKKISIGWRTIMGNFNNKKEISSNIIVSRDLLYFQIIITLTWKKFIPEEVTDLSTYFYFLINLYSSVLFRI